MDKFIDMQELIIISDLLITDYSTVYFDFILVKKPVILFSYDLDEYIKYPNIYFTLEDIAVGPIVKNGKELITGLKTLSNWLPHSKKRIEEIRNKYWDYHNGKSCERFFNLLSAVKTFLLTKRAVSFIPKSFIPSREQTLESATYPIPSTKALERSISAASRVIPWLL